MSPRNRLRGSRLTLLALVLVLAALLRLYRLGNENLWIDEVNQVQVASQSVREIVENYRPDAERIAQGRWLLRTWEQAPLSILVSHLFVRGESTEFWARLPSVLFGCLGVVALFAFANRFIPFRAASLSMFLLAISPLDIWYGQEARWYTQWSCYTTVSYLALAVAQRSGRLRYWMAYAVLTAASIYTFVFAYLFLLSQAVSSSLRALRSMSSKRSLATFASVLVLVILVTVPVTRMLLGSLENANSGTPRSSSVLELPYTFLTFSSGFTVGPSLADLHSPQGPGAILGRHPVIVAVLLVFGSIAVFGLHQLRSQRDLGSWLCPWLFVAPAGVFLIALILPDMTYQVRYSFAALPAFCLLLAIGLESLPDRLRWPALAAVVLLNGFALWNLYFDPAYDKADLRGAIAHVRSEGDGQSQVAVVGQVVLAMPFYGDHPDLEVVLGCGSKKGLRDPVDPLRRLWLVVGRDWESEGERCRRLLAETHLQSRSTEFPGIEIWRFEPKVRRADRIE